MPITIYSVISISQISYSYSHCQGAINENEKKFKQSPTEINNLTINEFNNSIYKVVTNHWMPVFVALCRNYLLVTY